MTQITEATSKKDSFAFVKESNQIALEKIEKFKNSPISTKARNLGFLGLSTVGLFFASLFMLQILSGLIALGVSIILIAVIIYGVKFLKNMDPLIQQKSKNILIKKMIDEAKNNAVEQLNSQVLYNLQKLENGRIARDKMGGLVEKLKSKVYFSNTQDKTNLQKIQMFTRVEEAYKSIKLSVENAAIKHKEFEQKVIEFKDLNSFAEIANEAMSLFENSFDSKLNDMLSLESFESIQMEFNTAIVSIENRAKDVELDNE